jgi:hypothetical protein
MERAVACPICQKRKTQRFCPARGDEICSVCCGTEREVSIDCPSDCPYLVASRTYDEERRKIDWSKLPFPDVKPQPSLARQHVLLLDTLTQAICAYARENPATVDTDAIASLQSLAEAYRTLTSGIYYEKPLDYRLQRELYARLKLALEDFKRVAAQEMDRVSARDGDIRDALVFFTQVGATHMNGRPKGRAFLDLLRKEFMPQEFSKPASNIVLLP